MIDSFRGFISLLESENQLVRIKRSVSTYLEINRIAKSYIEKDGAAAFFENVEGYSIPIVAGIFGKRERVFDLLGVSASNFEVEFNRRIERLWDFAPIIVEHGPVKDRILRGDEVDLNVLPFTKHGELDGGWYISSGVCLSKDPGTGVINASYHRLMRHGPRSLGIWMAPFDLRRIAEAYWAQGSPCPIAVVIGADPYTMLAACTSIEYDQDEMALAGSLRGKPIELAACESVPLEIPSGAEIVLEGWIHSNDELEEGPFAETSGYYSTPRMAPVIRITAITSRKAPFFHDIVTGIPPDENQAMLITHQAKLYKSAISLLPESVLEVYLTPGGCTSFDAVVKIKKKLPDEPKKLGHHLFSHMPRLKNVWVVDEDIDPANPIQVEWAYATRCRGGRNIAILSGVKGLPLDPLTRDGLIDKVIFDCTTPLPEEMSRGERVAIPCLK